VRRLASVALASVALVSACEPAPAPAPGPRAPAAAATSAPAAPPSAIRTDARSERKPVVVAIVVDQLSAWVAAERFAELPPKGAIARLRREGTWVKNLRFPYAVTDTAPGHASLHTGVVPAESGIFGNEVPNAKGDRVSFLVDDAVKVVTSDGVTSTPGSSAARLKVDTVADKLRAAHPDALVLSVSVKDRGAIMPAGKRPTHALWFDPSLDRFVTSTAFATTFPAWASPLAERGAAASRAKPWALADAAWVKAHAKTPDDAPGEGDYDGMGIVFPHQAHTSAGFRALPASDRVVLELAIRGFVTEYDPSKPTLILISISSSDVIGHVYGPDSWEAWDHLYELDAALDSFLAMVEAHARGRARVLLSADHGNASMPEARTSQPWCAKGSPPDPYDRPCGGGKRLGPTAVRDQLRAATKAALGEGAWVAGFADPYVYLTPEARALPEAKRAEIDRVIRREVNATGAIAEIYDVRDLAKKCPGVLGPTGAARGVPARALPGEDVLTLVCRSVKEGLGAGDYYLVPKHGSFFDGELVPGKGTSHGTPYLHDRTVPMLVRAEGLVDAGAVIDDPVDFSAYAALEAALLEIDGRKPRDILSLLRTKRP
jgi:predicted AlkP superfamily pyrophosphatase or phosphodiesterase